MSTATNLLFPRPEVWGGIECTVNRVGDVFNDQLECAGHYHRDDDLEKICALGIKKLRYPVLWEVHEPNQHHPIDWARTTEQLEKIRNAGVVPIAGLLHHGSGPAYTRLDDDNFPRLLSAFALGVAKQFPWLEYYTPVNEPLTTARFSGLYGHWYPHLKNNTAFLKMLLNQVQGTILSMQNIRKINPGAKLVQTEDLAFTHSTPLLSYQAHFENQRRWLTYDLLCGMVDHHHPMWKYFIDCGIDENKLMVCVQNPCPPDIIGVNYYVTSERWLDEDVKNYPSLMPGGNGTHQYVDTEAVRFEKQVGLGHLITDTWERYKIPMAVTECHLNCSREEQLRWFKETWDTCRRLTSEGINIQGVTAWSLFGAFNWDSLLTRDTGHYESGAFDLLRNRLRPTAISKMVQSIALNGDYNHPLLDQKGWWTRDDEKAASPLKLHTPLLIIGKSGTLGNAFARICAQRSIPYALLSREDVNICDESSIHNAVEKYNPWAIINATGFVRVDDAENDAQECFRVNADGPKYLSKTCFEKGIRFMTFSSDLVFDGCKISPYLEQDKVRSLNVYGASKAMGEKMVQDTNPESMIIRTSGFFGPWDQYNFVHSVLDSLKRDAPLLVADDIVTSPTYVPDLVNRALDLFIDEEAGIWHITNDGIISLAEFARLIAARGGFSMNKVQARKSAEMSFKARRPLFSALQSNKGIKLPSLEDALERCFRHQPKL